MSEQKEKKKFEFTPEQKEIVDFAIEQVEMGKPLGQNVLISGQGGVGKTTMVCELICILLKKGYKVACGAMTGKATGVLRQKIIADLIDNGIDPDDPKNAGIYANLKIETISKLTKKSKAMGTTAFGETIYTNEWIDPKTFDYDVLIIDELSMVPHYIQKWWSGTKCIVIGLGDFCQIPEVHTQETNKEIAGFRHDLKLPESKLVNGYGIQVLKGLSNFQLKEVLRSTGDITLFCNELRDFTKSKEQVIQLMKDWAAKSDDIEYSTDIHDIERGKDWQIIAYKNETCRIINEELAISTNYPDSEDKVILHDNINPIQAYNGEVYVFKDLLKKVNMREDVTVIWKFNNTMPSPFSDSLIEKQSYLDWMKYKSTTKDQHKKRLEELHKIIGNAKFLTDKQKENYYEIIKAFKNEFGETEECTNKIIQRFQNIDLDLSQLIARKLTPLAQVFFVNIGLGYCCTTHKSQGSEYDKVCYILERMDRPLLYTGCSRAKSKLKIIDLTSKKKK